MMLDRMSRLHYVTHYVPIIEGLAKASNVCYFISLQYDAR